MKSVDKFLIASKQSNLCVTGTKIGEQAFLLSQLDSPIFFVVGDSETAYKAHQQLLALNKRSALIDSIDNPYLISKYQSKDNKINTLNTLYLMATNSLDIVVITPEIINAKFGNANEFRLSIINLAVDQLTEVLM